MSLDIVAFYDKDEKKSPKIGFSNLELEQIQKKQIKT